MKTSIFTLFIFLLSSQILNAYSLDGLFSIEEVSDKSIFIKSIIINSPALRSDVKGKFKVRLSAKGMERVAAKCFVGSTWKKTVSEGHEWLITPDGISLNGDGEGSFTVDATKLPHGPISIHIYADNAKGERDVFELQLYNLTKSRKFKFSAGIPDTIPAAAKGLRLAFSDDFNSPLSISHDGRNARYNAHKPNFGDFSGWPFGNPGEEGDPFEQRDEYLIIHARKKEGQKGTTGLIASVGMDGSGFWAKPPFYMECRFTAQSAPGTWPAFWTITNPNRGQGDELDIIEAYGGWGEGNPNFSGYISTSHFWEQRGADGQPLKGEFSNVRMTRIGNHSSWSETFHTYGVRVNCDTTTYYFDNFPVFSHPTNSLSFSMRHIFLINYAIGGISGWKIDLSRFGNASDMYVDYVRVFTE